MQASIPVAGKPAVLVVDDQPVLRMTTTDILTDAGYRVEEAGNAQDALTLLELHPDVRVLVTEIGLPGLLDGLALARIVDLRWPGIRVVVSSGVRPGPGELPRRSRFLAKPYPGAALLSLVRDLLDPVAQAARGFDAVIIDPLYRPAAPITVPAPVARPVEAAIPPVPRPVGRSPGPDETGPADLPGKR